MAIQWFPGHMNKAKKAIAERAKSVDMVIEMLDARMPASRRIPCLPSFPKANPNSRYSTNKILPTPSAPKSGSSTTTAAPTPAPSPSIPPKPAHTAKSPKPAAP